MKKLFSKSILKQSLKDNWKMWLALTLLLCVFTTIMTLTAPNRADRIDNHPLFSEFSLIATYADMIFGLVGTLLIIIFVVGVGIKLVVSEVDKGTLSFELNTPTTRKQIILSKLVFYFTSLAAMVLMTGIVGTIMSSTIDLPMDYGQLWIMTLGFFLYGVAISGIVFFASCWFNKTGRAIMLGAGIPVIFFLITTLANFDDSLSFMRFFSLNTLFDTSAVMAGYTVQFIWQFAVLFLIGIGLYVAGTAKFLRKDLPL